MSDFRQQDLFSPSTLAAVAARDEALGRVAANAEDASPGFAQRARDFVLCYLTLHDAASGEDITDAALAAGVTPHDLRAFGPVYLALAREGRIVKVGTRPRRRGHNTSGGNVWKLSLDPNEGDYPR